MRLINSLIFIALFISQSVSAEFVTPREVKNFNEIYQSLLLINEDLKSEMAVISEVVYLANKSRGISFINKAWMDRIIHLYYKDTNEAKDFTASELLKDFRGLLESDLAKALRGDEFSNADRKVYEFSDESAELIFTEITPNFREKGDLFNVGFSELFRDWVGSNIIKAVDLLEYIEVANKNTNGFYTYVETLSLNNMFKFLELSYPKAQLHLKRRRAIGTAQSWIRAACGKSLKEVSE